MRDTIDPLFNMWEIITTTICRDSLTCLRAHRAFFNKCRPEKLSGKNRGHAQPKNLANTPSTWVEEGERET